MITRNTQNTQIPQTPSKRDKAAKPHKRYKKTFLTDFISTPTSTRLTIKVIDSPLSGCINQTNDIQSLTVVLEDTISVIKPLSVNDTEVMFVIQEPLVSVQGLFLNTLVSSIELERA